jgi:LPS-assembly protein
LRILTERYDTFNPFSGAFEAQNITIPRLTYTLYPKRNKYFYTNFNTTLQNQYLGSLDYYLISGNADSNITFDRRLRKNITFTPTFGITETWQDRTSSIDLNDIFVTQYYSNLNLRYRPTRSMDWDFRYNYRLRSKMNSLLPDSNADDYGEVTNQVTFFNSLYISMEVVMRNSIGYNFRKLRSENIDSWMRKFNPQVNEFTWTPRMPFYVYLRQENDIYPYSFRALQVDSRVGNPDIRYLNLGVFYQSARPDQLDFITGIGFWPTKKWRIDYVIRPRTLNNFREVQVNDQELKLFRDLHCWEFKLTYRRRGTAEEFFVLLDLMSAARNREKLYEPRQEREFYPWRYPDLSY